MGVSLFFCSPLSNMFYCSFKLFCFTAKFQYFQGLYKQKLIQIKIQTKSTQGKGLIWFPCFFFHPFIKYCFFYSSCKLFCFKPKFKNRQGRFKQKLIQIQTKSTKWKGMVWDVPCFYFSLYQLCFYFVIFSPTAPGISSGF